MKKATLKAGGRLRTLPSLRNARKCWPSSLAATKLGQHINGKATLGENIADLGGIVIGLDAFKKTDQYKEGKTING
jgi:hypothetical protein